MKTARFFCDLSPHSLAITNALISVGMVVRLLPLSVIDWTAGDMGMWGAHRLLFLTAIDGPYVNLVSGSFGDWERLHTSGVENYLVTSDPPVTQARWPKEWLKAIPARLYDTVIVPTHDVAKLWQAVDKRTIVLPQAFSTQEAESLRDTLNA